MYHTLFLLLIPSSESVINDMGNEKCDGLVFNNVYYDKQELFPGFGQTFNLLMHLASGNLFFSHFVNPKNKTYGITACNIQKMTCKQVLGVKEGYAIAYDRANDKIYFGGKGIYKYNFQKQYGGYFAQKYKIISDLSIGRNFYFIEKPTKRLYIYRKGHFVETNKTKNIEIEKFFVSRGINIYFSNKTGLYKVEKPYKHPKTYLLSNELIVNQIIEDFRGNVYFCATDGIYIEDKTNRKLRKIANIDHANALTFDIKRQVIFSDDDAIYRLLPSELSDNCSYTDSKGNVIIKEKPSTILTTASTKEVKESGHVTVPLHVQRRHQIDDESNNLPEFMFRGNKMHF